MFCPRHLLASADLDMKKCKLLAKMQTQFLHLLAVFFDKLNSCNFLFIALLCNPASSFTLLHFCTELKTKL